MFKYTKDGLINKKFTNPDENNKYFIAFDKIVEKNSKWLVPRLSFEFLTLAFVVQMVRGLRERLAQVLIRAPDDVSVNRSLSSSFLLSEKQKEVSNYLMALKIAKSDITRYMGIIGFALAIFLFIIFFNLICNLQKTFALLTATIHWTGFVVSFLSVFSLILFYTNVFIGSSEEIVVPGKFGIRLFNICWNAEKSQFKIPDMLFFTLLNADVAIITGFLDFIGIFNLTLFGLYIDSAFKRNNIGYRFKSSVKSVYETNVVSALIYLIYEQTFVKVMKEFKVTAFLKTSFILVIISFIVICIIRHENNRYIDSIGQKSILELQKDFSVDIVEKFIEEKPKSILNAVDMFFDNPLVFSASIISISYFLITQTNEELRKRHLTRIKSTVGRQFLTFNSYIKYKIENIIRKNFSGDLYSSLESCLGEISESEKLAKYTEQKNEIKNNLKDLLLMGHSSFADIKSSWLFDFPIIIRDHLSVASIIENIYEENTNYTNYSDRFVADLYKMFQNDSLSGENNGRIKDIIGQLLSRLSFLSSEISQISKSSKNHDEILQNYWNVSNSIIDTVITLDFTLGVIKKHHGKIGSYSFSSEIFDKTEIFDKILSDSSRLLTETLIKLPDNRDLDSMFFRSSGIIFLPRFVNNISCDTFYSYLNFIFNNQERFLYLFKEGNSLYSRIFALIDMELKKDYFKPLNHLLNSDLKKDAIDTMIITMLDNNKENLYYDKRHLDSITSFNSDLNNIYASASQLVFNYITVIFGLGSRFIRIFFRYITDQLNLFNNKKQSKFEQKISFADELKIALSRFGIRIFAIMSLSCFIVSSRFQTLYDGNLTLSFITFKRILGIFRIKNLEGMFQRNFAFAIKFIIEKLTDIEFIYLSWTVIHLRDSKYTQIDNLRDYLASNYILPKDKALAKSMIDNLSGRISKTVVYSSSYDIIKFMLNLTFSSFPIVMIIPWVQTTIWLIIGSLSSVNLLSVIRTQDKNKTLT